MAHCCCPASREISVLHTANPGKKNQNSKYEMHINTLHLIKYTWLNTLDLAWFLLCYLSPWENNVPQGTSHSFSLDAENWTRTNPVWPHDLEQCHTTNLQSPEQAMLCQATNTLDLFFMHYLHIINLKTLEGKRTAFFSWWKCLRPANRKAWKLKGRH